MVANLVVVALYMFRAWCVCRCNLAEHEETREDPMRRINGESVSMSVDTATNLALTTNSNRDVYPFYNTVNFIYMQRTHISFVVLLMPYYRILLYSHRH